MAKFWRRIRKIRGKYASHKPPCLSLNGSLTIDTQTVADSLAVHLASVSSDNQYPADFLPIKNHSESVNLNFNSSNMEPYNEPINITELTSALRNCKNTAPGYDEIHYAMLKRLSRSAYDFLLFVYNKIYESRMPKIWGKALVLPIAKPNKDPHLVSSYRPIALTSSVCKLLKKILNMRLMHYLEKGNFLSPSQYGFRKRRSTVDSLVRLDNDILNAFARQQQLKAVFFDIEKAYDTTWCYHILHYVHRVGIRGRLANFIRYFLQDRHFCVSISDIKSMEQKQAQGVPQGAVLSVTLFIVAIDGVAGAIPHDVNKLLYVDDLAIYFASRNSRTIERKLQIAINQITHWTREHTFKFSINKTVAVQFHRKRGMQYEPNLLLYIQPIIFKESTRFLGLILD